MSAISGKAQYSPDTAAMLRELSVTPEFKIAYSLPSTIQYRLPFSINSLTADFNSEESKEPYVSDAGGIETGEYFGRINAAGYIKYKSSTLWGNFHYDNGRQRNVRWSETSDIPIIYPYITADAIGGDIRFEKYCFSGGYADHRAKWEWGAGIAYDAGQYYREIDPRPKNLTGLLRINAGGGRHIAYDYHISAGLEYDRYTQSNDITFVSEMGESKIYQLTGLGTHYIRFDGNGQSAHFGGNAISGKVAITPGGGNGFVGGAEYTYYKFNKILDDLNKLPLAVASENSFSCEIGWNGVPVLSELIEARWRNSFAVAGYFSTSQRTGHENLFGDPASAIYPLTGTKEAYHSTFRKYGVRGFWQRNYGVGTSLKVETAISDSRFHENHLDPIRFHTVSIINLEGGVSGSRTLPGKINLRIKIFGSWTAPHGSRYYIGTQDEKIDDKPTESFSMRVEDRSLHKICRGFEILILRALSAKFSLSIEAGYRSIKYCNGNRFRRWNIEAGVIF